MDPRQNVPNVGPRVMTVPNEDGTIEQNQLINKLAVEHGQIDPAKVQEMRNQAKQTVPSATKSALEILCGLGRKTKTINIEGVQFSLKTLKNKELKRANELLGKLQPSSDLVLGLLFRICTLAYSLYEIDNKSIVLVLGTDDSEVVAEMLQEMENSVIDSLYEAYVVMRDGSIKEQKLATQNPKELEENLKK